MSPLQARIRSGIALLLILLVLPLSHPIPETNRGKWLLLIFMCYIPLVYVWVTGDAVMHKYRLTLRSKAYLVILMPLTLCTYLIKSRSRRRKASWLALALAGLALIFEWVSII